MSQSPSMDRDSISRVNRSSVVSVILQIVCNVTGMGFAAVAKVTDRQWIACEVRDQINFGLKPGEELKLDTTICHEIRQSGLEVVIDHVAEDKDYCGHHTPTMYGFQSYISVPIRLADSSFFGTLCAIDPNPARLKGTAIVDLFKTYAAIIGFLIDAEDLPLEVMDRLRQRTLMALRAHLVNITGFNMEEHSGGNKPAEMQAEINATLHKIVAGAKELLQSLKAEV